MDEMNGDAGSISMGALEIQVMREAYEALVQLDAAGRHRALTRLAERLDLIPPRTLIRED